MAGSKPTKTSIFLVILASVLLLLVSMPFAVLVLILEAWISLHDLTVGRLLRWQCAKLTRLRALVLSKETPTSPPSKVSTTRCTPDEWLRCNCDVNECKWANLR